MPTDTRRLTRTSNKTPSVPPPGNKTKKSALLANSTGSSTNMEANTSRSNNEPIVVTEESNIMDQLNTDIAGLSPDLMKLAQAIVKALLTVSDAKLEAERKRHELEVEGLRKQIQELADEKDDLENYGRRNTFVISGPAITPVATHEDTYSTVINILNSKVGFQLSRQDIDVCHRLPISRGGDASRQPDPTKKPIIVKLVRREVKHQILRAVKDKKPKDIYFNESLSSTH